MMKNFAATAIYQLFPPVALAGKPGLLMHNTAFGEETKLGSCGYFVCKDCFKTERAQIIDTLKKRRPPAAR